MEWAQASITRKLSDCYARYEKEDMKQALLATMDLFRSTSVEAAHKLDYDYPVKADAYSTDWVAKALIP